MAEDDNRAAEAGRVSAELGRVGAEDHRIEVMTDLIAAQHDLAGKVSTLTSEVRSFAHRNWRLLVSVVLLVLVLLAIAVWNRESLSIVKSATNPEGEIYRRGQANTVVVVAGLAIESDCRARRQAAGLPAPKPAFKPGDKTCADQTPAHIYPGPGGSSPEEGS